MLWKYLCWGLWYQWSRPSSSIIFQLGLLDVAITAMSESNAAETTWLRFIAFDPSNPKIWLIFNPVEDSGTAESLQKLPKILSRKKGYILARLTSGLYFGLARS